MNILYEIIRNEYAKARKYFLPSTQEEFDKLIDSIKENPDDIELIKSVISKFRSAMDLSVNITETMIKVNDMMLGYSERCRKIQTEYTLTDEQNVMLYIVTVYLGELMPYVSDPETFMEGVKDGTIISRLESINDIIVLLEDYYSTVKE